MIHFFNSSFFIILFLWSGLSHSQTSSFKVPSLTGPVIDQAQFLNTFEASQLSRQIKSLKNENLAQVQILIIQSIDNLSLEEIAIQTFDQLKLGREKQDDGLLILISDKEKKIRLEVGQGLEGALPDSVAKRLIQEIINPLFKAQQRFLGLQILIQAIRQAAFDATQNKTFNIDQFKTDFLNSHNLEHLNRSSTSDSHSEPNSENNIQRKKKKIPSAIIFLVLAGLWLILFFISPSTALWILYSILSSGRSGGGGSGGGNWSGGGGRSSGGGASGGW